MKHKKPARGEKRPVRKPAPQAVQMRAQEYPSFFFDEKEGDPQFVELIRAAIRSFSFEELSRNEQLCFRQMRSGGSDWAYQHLRAAMDLVQGVDPDNLTARFADLQWALNLGQTIFDKIPEPELRKHLPVNDAFFRYLGDKIVVQFRSLMREYEGGKAFYYSRRKPTLDVGGKAYIVAFSKHAIDATCNRIRPDWMTYAGLGDVFAYLEECIYYEACQLSNHPLAFTFYDICGDPRFGPYQYVTEVLGADKLDPALGKPYYRVGYCPADIIDGRFIRARTLLFPGYRQTPEYRILQNSSLSHKEKARLGQLAQKSDVGTLADTGDFSALKWFHDNGAPQVIQTTRFVYDKFGVGRSP
jgi:hypothetical protein